MEDIAPELLEQIRALFLKLLGDDKPSADTYAAAGDYAERVGDALAATFQKHLSGDVLPDGKMYWNIADRVVRPLLEEDWQLCADVAAGVQRVLNTAAGIGLAPQVPQPDKGRIDGFLNKLCEAQRYEDVASLLDTPVRTFSRAAVDETLRRNAEFHAKAGLRPRIVRTAEHGCCKWCSALAGTYSYPGVPDDVYKRHANCRCSVEYNPGDNKRQDVWTKRWTDGQERDILEYRITFDSSPQDSKPRFVFHSIDDPMVEVTGPAELSHPDEIAAFIKEIQDSGAELIRHESENLGYNPGRVSGEPGQVSVSFGASYSAWCHEMQHMRDDRAHGWQGMRIVCDLDERYRRECRAYQIEIDLAMAANRPDIAERLRENLAKEKVKIYGRSE